MPYNLRSNPTKRIPYSPPEPPPKSKTQRSDFFEENIVTMSNYQNNAEDDEHMLLNEAMANNSNQEEFPGFNPDDQSATDPVRRMLRIPTTGSQGRHSLPAAYPNTQPPPNHGPFPTSFGQAFLPPTNPNQQPSQNNRAFPTNFGLPFVPTVNGSASRRNTNTYPPIPPMYPFLTPPPPPPPSMETNRLLSVLIDKLDRGFTETQKLRQEWNSFQSSQRGATQNSHPNSDSHLSSRAPSNQNMNNEPDLEQQVAHLNAEISRLTERLNSANLVDRNSAQSYRVPPLKWNVKFINMTVESFIFQITSLRRSNNCDWNDVLACFHLFLEGNAINWYWNLRSTTREEEFDWDYLSAQLILKYGNRKTDEEIWLQMAERKQGEREKFKDFYEAIERIHSLCREPRTDKSLMKLIRNSSKLAIQKHILTYEPDNLNDFIQKCEDYDQLLFPYLYKSAQNRRADVSSFELTDLSNEALSYKGCLNCGQTDHFVKQCPQPIQLNCFKCHKKGFTVRTCPDCNQNFQVSEMIEEPPPQH